MFYFCILFILFLLFIIWFIRLTYFAFKLRPRKKPQERTTKKVLFLCSFERDLAVLGLIPHLNEILGTKNWMDIRVDMNALKKPDYCMDLSDQKALDFFVNESFDSIVLFCCPCCTNELMETALHLPIEIARILKNHGFLYLKDIPKGEFYSHWKKESLLVSNLYHKMEISVFFSNPLWPFKKWKNIGGVYVPFTFFKKFIEKRGDSKSPFGRKFIPNLI